MACSSQSKSEIVLPLREGAQVIGVLDIDSTNYAEFDQTDQKEIAAMLAVIEKSGQLRWFQEHV